MIRPIVAYGDPVLKKEAQELESNHPELAALIADMWETMYEADGVGLAAPQIGLSLRLFVADGSPFGEGEDGDPGCKGFKRVTPSHTLTTMITWLRRSKTNRDDNTGSKQI